MNARPLQREPGPAESASDAPRPEPALALDVCICTHDPRRDVLATVLDALAAQDADRSSFGVVVVDNASDPALTPEDFGKLGEAGISFRLVREERLGNVFARAAAIAATTSPWVLFVDDDNELDPDYISRGLRLIETRPDLGCFGGRLALPAHVTAPGWVLPLLPFLAIRDYGNDEITRVADHWGEWEPATAGGFVHRRVLEVYLNRIGSDGRLHRLGRKAGQSLNSGEDSLMMWGAHSVGLAASYQPGLRLRHHVDSRRFGFWYLLRLMRGYGRSNAILDKLYARAQPARSAGVLAKRFLGQLRSKPLRYAVCMAAYDAAYNAELSRP